MRSTRADCKLIPRACSQSPWKIALDCSVLAEPEVSTVFIKIPEPLLVGQCAVSQWTNAVFPKAGKARGDQSLIYAWVPGLPEASNLPAVILTPCPALCALQPLPTSVGAPWAAPCVCGGHPSLKLPIWLEAEHSSLVCNCSEFQSCSQYHFWFLSVFVSCCLWWAQEVWGCMEIAVPRQERHKVHPPLLQNHWSDERFFIPAVAKNALSVL